MASIKMSTEFTVLISSDNEISVNQMGELLSMIETRGIVIEEIHHGNMMEEPDLSIEVDDD